MRKSRLIYRFFLLLICAQSWCFANVADTFERIKSDPLALYAFFKEMPKGGELHYHLAGGAYPEAMLDLAAQEDFCINAHDFTLTRITDGCLGVKTKNINRNPAFYEQTLRAWSLKDFIAGKESSAQHFFATFYKFMPLISDYSIPLLAEIMQRAANQHEHYLEIMIMPDNGQSASMGHVVPRADNYLSIKKQLLADKRFLAEIDNTVANAAALLPATQTFLGCDRAPQQPVCRLSVKFQYYVLREQPLEQVFSQALHGFIAASRSSAIVGINLVQAEDGVISLRDYHQQMAIFRFMHQLWPEVPISLHAGELAPESVPPEALRYHIREAVEIAGARRIGHGVDIAFEDRSQELLNEMAKKQVAVEVNLVSNEKILHVSGAFHPLRYYLAHQVPVVLSTDDEGVLRTDLTRQYVAAVLQHKLDYPTIKQINRNALSYSFLPGKSVWVHPAQAVLVAECRELNSPACERYVAANEKARLQRNLELQLMAFERSYQ